MLCTSEARSAKPPIRAYEARTAAASPSRVIGRSMRAWAAAAARRVESAVASIISRIGVMPAIGSFGNDPMAYETAPMRRPST